MISSCYKFYTNLHLVALVFLILFRIYFFTTILFERFGRASPEVSSVVIANLNCILVIHSKLMHGLRWKPNNSAPAAVKGNPERNSNQRQRTSEGGRYETKRKKRKHLE